MLQSRSDFMPRIILIEIKCILKVGPKVNFVIGSYKNKSLTEAQTFL